jgi:hypothetical protein
MYVKAGAPFSTLPAIDGREAGIRGAGPSWGRPFQWSHGTDDGSLLRHQRTLHQQPSRPAGLLAATERRE